MERLRARLTGEPPATSRAGARPADDARTLAAARRSERHEHLRTRHPPADRHHAARHRAVAGGHRGLSLPAGRQHADRRFPDHQREREPARRRSGDHGGDGRGAARAPARRNPGRDRDDLAQLARLDPHLDPVRPQPQHRRRRARRAGRDQRRADRPAGRPAVAAVVPQVQSGGDADHDPGADLAHRAAERDLRRRRHRGGAAPRAGRRRRRGQRQRRRAAGDPRAGQSDRARLHGARRWRTCAPRSPTPMRPGPLGVFDGDGRAVTIGINDQLRAASQYDPLVVRTANGTVVRLSAIASIEPGVRNSRSFGWYNRPALGAAGHHQGGRRQRDRDRRPHPRAASPRSSAGFPPTSTSRSSPTAPARSAPASATCSSRCWRPSCW